MDRCDLCGFGYDLDRYADAPAEIRAGTSRLAELLCTTADADLRRRPRPDVWSPLEYGCHVRDVLLVQRERVLAARRAERPSVPPMGRDERAEHDGYADQAPAAVARQLTDAAALLANVFDRLAPAGWDRTLMYNYPDLQERTLRWVAVHTWHEVHHHLLDARPTLVTDGGKP